MKSLLVVLFLVPTSTCFASGIVTFGPHLDRDNDQKEYRCILAGESLTCNPAQPTYPQRPCWELWPGIDAPPRCRSDSDWLPHLGVH
jgi:hypothetical protein